MKSQELFPETLLVSREGEHIYTTSRRVAFYFGKKHKNVIQSIENLKSSLSVMDVNGLNFQPVNEANAPNFGAINGPKIGPVKNLAEQHFTATTYLDAKGESRPEYRLTEEGFSLLTMGFTGDKALRWKWAFLQQFLQQRAELADHHARRIAALDALHPNLLPTVEDYERGLPRCTTAQRLGRSVAAVTYPRRKARRLGLLAAPAARGQG